MSPADLARFPAVRLFVERVRDVQPDFRLTSANGPTVVAICRRLDALPLALELAAPWMKVLTAEDLLRRLGHDVLLSTAGPRDLPERQQTMNATVAWSYQLLGPNEQRAFRRFGALPGLFPIDAAAAVLAGREAATAGSDEALRAAAGLIDKSLLLRAETSVALVRCTRCSRRFGRTRRSNSTAPGRARRAMEGVARHGAGEASLAAEGLVGPAQAEWLDRVREDLESYRGAAWLIERGRPSEAADIAWGLKYFWLIRGHAAEGLQWYEQILNLPSLPPAAELRALAGATVMWYTQGELERAAPASPARSRWATAPATWRWSGRPRTCPGTSKMPLGDADAAREPVRRQHRRGSARWRTHRALGNALSGMAAVALATGDTDQAERLLDEATSVLRHAGPWFLTWALYVRAILAVRRGKPDEAIALVRESLTRIRELHDKFAFVYALVPLAAAAVFKGDDAWAARILGARDAVTERTGVTVVDKSVLDLREQAEREARARLARIAGRRAYAAGRLASIDALLKDIERASRSRAHA